MRLEDVSSRARGRLPACKSAVGGVCQPHGDPVFASWGAIDGPVMLPLTFRAVVTASSAPIRLAGGPSRGAASRGGA